MILSKEKAEQNIKEMMSEYQENITWEFDWMSEYASTHKLNE